MKISTNLKSPFKMLLAAVTLSAVLGACTKDLDNRPAPLVSGLNIINASPGTEIFDFYVDNTKALITTPTVEFTYTTKVGYYNLYAGQSQIAVTKKNSNVPLLTEKFTLEPSMGYSLFAIDKLESIKFLMLKDSIALPATGKANVRFVNLSPDAPALNLAIAGSTTDLVMDKAFKQYSKFIIIDAAEKVTFNAKNKETGVVETSLADVKIESGKTYTIWVKGFKAGTDVTKLGLTIFTH